MIKLTKHFTLLIFGLMASSTIFFSCTDVDKTLGLGFIPDEEKRDFKVDTIYPDAYTVSIGNTYTHASPYSLVVGNLYDPMFGLTTAGCVFQIFPVKDSVKFDKSTPVSELTLKMVVNREPIGNATSSQTISIYELKDRIYIDSGYYANTPIRNMIDSNPIATYTYSGEDTIKIDLRGTDFAKKLTEASESAMIKDRDSIKKSQFFDYVKGLYIVSDSPSGNERMNFIDPEAYLTLIYGNASKDTLIYRTLYTYDYNNNRVFWTQFNTVEHDYSKANPAQKMNHLNDTIPTAQLDSVVYLQGFFGATPYIKVPSKKLNNWLQKIKLDKSQVAIIRAELIMEVEDNFNGFDLSKYPSRLGGMILLNHLFTYSPYYGTLYDSGALTTFYYSPGLFDGLLNGSHKKYSFNITHEILDLLHNGKNENDLEFYLTTFTSNGKESSASSKQLIYSIAPSQYKDYKAVMRGSKHSKPLKLVITYAIPQ